MNRNQTILAAIGGVVLVAVLAIGYFIWDASSVSSENSETLDDCMAAASGILRKLPVPPANAELKVYDDSCQSYGEWKDTAEKFASRGDLVFPDTTPAVFKSEMVAEARRLAQRPGEFGGKLVKGDFTFGFKEYVLGSALPPSGAKLKKLQREWNDVSAVLKMLADSGAVGITDVKMGKAKLKGEAEAEAEKPKAKGKAKSKSKAKAKTEKRADSDEGGEGEEGEYPAVTSFTVEFHARPSALVKAINAFTTDQRFIVIEDFGFVPVKDDLSEVLGGGAKKQEQTSSRRRRRSQAEEVKTDDSAAKRGVAIDPATAAPLKVTMAISVYDFGSLEKAKAEMESKGEAKEDEGEDKGGAK